MNTVWYVFTGPDPAWEFYTTMGWCGIPTAVPERHNGGYWVPSVPDTHQAALAVATVALHHEGDLHG